MLSGFGGGFLLGGCEEGEGRCCGMVERTKGEPELEDNLVVGIVTVVRSD
jgi:hypothetical protein